MMVTVAGGEGFLSPLLSGNKVSSMEFYSSLTEKLEDEETLAQLCEEIQHQSSDVASKICEDLASTNTGVAMATLQGLGICLHHEDIVKAFKEADSKRLLDGICKTVKETSDKNICTRALWCLATQRMPRYVISEKVSIILEAIEHALCEKNFKSMTVEHEGLNAYIRLLEQDPEEMSKYPVKWAKLIYPLLLHGAVKVRDRAVIAMDLGMPAILEHQSEIAKLLMADLKSKDKNPSLLIDQINNLMTTRQEIFAMKVWEYYVTILGKLLHHGQLINQLLPFVEMAFKNPAPEIKCAAYRAWKTLIKNFSLNPDIVSDGKRVKLVMQVFKLSNAKVESVALAKVSVWWFFIQKLGPNSTIYFDSVVAPLLNFCIGGLANKAGAGSRTPTSRLGMIASPATPNIPGSPMPQFRALQFRGAEIVGRLLGTPTDDPSLPKPVFTIGELEHVVISGPAFFVKNSQILITAVRECISNLQEDLSEGLLYHLWFSLVAHVKNVIDTGNKSDSSDVLSMFLLCLQHLITSQSLKPMKLLKLLQAVLVLPPKALSSSSYAIGTSQTGMMQGTPVLFTLDLLFHHRLLETCSKQERFFLLLEKLINCGLTNQNGALAFCKAVLQLLDQSASKIEHRETLWRIWSAVVNPLHEHISKTNEVNAGDALEHDFTCLYAALLLPLAHLLRSDFPMASHKSMMKTWSELYSTFSRLAAMVTNAEANICCEELCARIASLLDNNRDALKDFRCVETLAQVVQTVIKYVDFSGVTSSGVFNMNPAGILSPGKFMNKKKQRPLGNLHSLIGLTVLVSNALVENVNGESGLNVKKQLSAPGLQIAALSITEVLSMIFTHLPSSTVIAVATEKLSHTLAEFFEGAAKKPTGKMYSTQVLQKLDKLFLDFVTCITGRYNGPFDSDFLAQLAPVLKSTFLHPRRPLKNQSIVLWNATFSKSPPLEYPQELKVVLAKVREKAPLVLPGWDASEVILREETPISQMSQGGESEVYLPNIVGLPSPHKKVGSFMVKVASPEVKKSPLKRVKSPVISGARKKLGLDDLKDADFVVIAPSNIPKKRVLTEHQREVLREKSVLPAMYSNLDISQDRSFMSQFNNSVDVPSTEASQDPFSFAIPFKKQESSAKIALPSASNDETANPTEGKTTRSSAQRRKSVTFALGSAQTGPNQSVDVKEPVIQASSGADPVERPEMKKPMRLFGQTLNGVEDISDFSVKSSGKQVGSDESVKEHPISSEDSGKEDDVQSPNDSDGPDNQSQASETILKPKTREHLARSAVASSGHKHNKSPERRTRSLSADKSPKKPLADGMKKLENWFSVSPKKRVPETPVVIVEDSQQFSSSKSDELTTSSPTTIGSSVKETPEKMEVEETQDSADTGLVSKQLFSLEQPFVVPDSEIADKGSPRSSDEIVVPESVDFNPVVQLSRLPVDLLKTYSPKKSSFASISALSNESCSDDTVAKVSTSTDSKVKRLKRRGSFRMSKASQEKPSPISPVSMDDIIPSSQDSFGLSASRFADEKIEENVEKETNGEFVALAPASEKNIIESSQEEQMEVDDTSKGDQHKLEAEKKEDSTHDSNILLSDERDPSENPDISPADICDIATSQDSDATIVSKPKRGRRKKMPNALDLNESKPQDSESASELSETQDSKSSDKSAGQRRPSRRRSVPKKYFDTDNTNASSTPEKNKGKNEDKVEINLRPNETLVSRAYDSSQDSELPALKRKGKQKSLGKKMTQEGRQKNGKNEGQDLNKIVSKKCNLDKDTDSEDDIPINILAKKQKADISFGSDEDNVPLTHLKKEADEKMLASESQPQENVSESEGKDEEPRGPLDHVDSDEKVVPTEEENDSTSVREIFAGTEKTSTPSKSSNEDKKIVQQKKMLSILSIDMKTSPVNKRLRSKVSLKLNRSLSSLQRRRRSPGSPGHRRLRSKSVSPLKRSRKTRRLLAPVPAAQNVQDSVEILPTVSSVKLEEGEDTETTKSELPIEKLKESPRKSPQKLPSDTVDIPKEVSSPRRSPRKQTEIIEESPQKKSLSPNRQSVALEEPETPTSATKHQSRARIILERSRLFASRSSRPSTSLQTKKKFTTLKAPGQLADSPTRSILKPAAAESDGTSEGIPAESASPPPSKSCLSTNSPTFRPIQLPRMYSPSASPSAGILKKRKLSGEVPVDSPSPPNKQRRVSFNEAVDVCTLATKESPRPVNRCLDMPAKVGRMTSPLVTTTSKVTTNQSKFLTRKSELNDTEKDDSGFTVPLPLNKKKDDQSQNSMKSTQESQLNCEDPVYPELITCTDSIDQILPQLTSSTWIRGLGQLVRSKNIRTVGDLCRLTEYDVNNLPIRTPKVATVRQVLQAHQIQWNLKKLRAPSAQVAVTPGSDEIMDEGSSEEFSIKSSQGIESPLSPKKPLPSVEDALAMSPIKEADTSLESMTTDDVHLALTDEPSPSKSSIMAAGQIIGKLSDIEETQDTEPQDFEFRDPFGSLTITAKHSLADSDPSNDTQDSEAHLKAKFKAGISSSSGDSTDKVAKVSSRKLLKDIEAMTQRLTPEALGEMPSSYLVAIHLHLNTMMTNVIVAQSNKCPLSPTASQNSQSQ